MTRTVVSIFTTNNDRVNFNLYFAPGNFQNARELFEFECTENDDPFRQMSQGMLQPDIIRCVGKRLFEHLSRHPAVKQAIDLALTSTPDRVAPLYIHLNSDKAEGLPWETLCSPEEDFLALDRRWPIARIADSSAMLQRMNRTFRPPLKVMLILGAAGADATPEWNSFYEAVKDTMIAWQLQVLVCQDELKTEIEGLNDERVTVQSLSSQPDLLHAIKDFAPHILHFFCHGSTDGGAHLQLASRSDWKGRQPGGSIYIDPRDLYEFSSANSTSGNIWFVILNCCLGGAAVADADATAQDVYSLARLLVTNGFPAAIGMRELIATNDAHVFCRAFYPSVLSILGEVDQQGKTDKDFIAVEWARTLQQPRAQLLERHRENRPPRVAAAISKEWTLPIIYVRPELFLLRMRSTNPEISKDEGQELRTQIKLLRTNREHFQTLPDFPQAALTEIDEHIASLEAKLFAHQ